MEQLYKRTFDQVHMPEERVQMLREELSSRCTQNMQENQEAKTVKQTKKLGKVALVAALAAVLCCIGVGATVVRQVILMTPEQRSTFYEEIFGDTAQKSVEAVYEEDGEGRVMINLPNSERVPVEQAEAADLIGPYLSEEVYVLTGKGYTLTVEGYVFDRATLTGQMYYSLENPDGITGIAVSEWDNEVWADGTGINVTCSASGHTYLDPERSTDTKYYMIAPLAMWKEESEINLELIYRNMEELSSWETLDQASLPIGANMPSVTVEQGGKNAVFSAIGMCLTGFQDHAAIDYIALEYRDGSRYELRDDAANLDNTAYGLAAGGSVGLDREEFHLVFNRLVDIGQVTAVLVDDMRLPVA